MVWSPEQQKSFYFTLYTLRLTHRLYTQWALDKCVMFEMYLTKTKIGEKNQDNVTKHAPLSSAFNYKIDAGCSPKMYWKTHYIF